MPPWTLTLDELITRLEAKRERYGGTLPVYLENEDPGETLGITGVSYQDRRTGNAKAPGVYLQGAYETLLWIVRQRILDAKRDMYGELH